MNYAVKLYNADGVRRVEHFSNLQTACDAFAEIYENEKQYLSIFDDLQIKTDCRVMAVSVKFKTSMLPLPVATLVLLPCYE